MRNPCRATLLWLARRQTRPERGLRPHSHHNGGLCHSLRPFLRPHTTVPHNNPLLLSVLAWVRHWRGLPSLGRDHVGIRQPEDLRRVHCCGFHDARHRHIRDGSGGVSNAFLMAYPAPDFKGDKVLSTQPEGDYVWRIVLMFA